jgi:hypothetical protein
MNERELEKIRLTAVKILGLVRGTPPNRVASGDLASWRTPGRLDYLIESIVTNAGKSTIPVDQAKERAIEFGFTWDPAMEEAIEQLLKPLGISLSKDKYESPNYDTPTREKLLQSAGPRVRRVLRGISW